MRDNAPVGGLLCRHQYLDNSCTFSS